MALGVAREAVAAGADLVNDTWAGHDPALVEVAGAAGVGVVCSHTGGAVPRTDPYRVEYPPRPDAGPRADPRDGVVDDVVATLRSAAARAVACGVPPRSVLVDPTHDFGKNTWHSLHLLRRTEALAGLGYPLLMALSRKDFVGETLGLGPDDRLEGTLAATALAAWLGASVFRAHGVAATRRCSTWWRPSATRRRHGPSRVGWPDGRRSRQSAADVRGVEVRGRF